MSRSTFATRRAVTPVGVLLAVVLMSGLLGCGKKSEGGTVVRDAAPRCAKAPALAKSKDKPTKVEVPSAPVTELVSQDLKKGTGAPAEKGKQLTVNYIGISCTTGIEFDTSWGKKGKDKDDPLDFVLGSGEVIKGWDTGLLGMKVGGLRRLVIPGELAYGAAGRPPQIQANDTLVFVVQLKAVKVPTTTTTTTAAPTTAAPTTAPKATTTGAAPKTTTGPTAVPKSGSTTTTIKP